ncbi:SDR family oxidoreductase [Kribbella sp. NPDC006257]|uniref:SDR family oxidoreductase n=1 Tax=Kribbella sp. NPDC006257 TaxID=3156738 RepID=UPI0033AD6149
MQADEAAEVPMRRFGTVPEFAAIGAFLCSDLSSYLTGTAIPLRRRPTPHPLKLRTPGRR